jgi:hypothetical protein
MGGGLSRNLPQFFFFLPEKEEKIPGRVLRNNSSEKSPTHP